jgi:hypothetical protein
MLALGTDPSPLAQDDNLVENACRHTLFVQCLNGGVDVFPNELCQEAHGNSVFPPGTRSWFYLI